MSCLLATAHGILCSYFILTSFFCISDRCWFCLVYFFLIFFFIYFIWQFSAYVRLKLVNMTLSTPVQSRAIEIFWFELSVKYQHSEIVEAIDLSCSWMFVDCRMLRRQRIKDMSDGIRFRFQSFFLFHSRPFFWQMKKKR